MQQSYDSKKAGIEAAKLAGQVRDALFELYSDPDSAGWFNLANSIAVYYDDDLADGVLEMMQYAKTFKLPPKYFPRFFDDLVNMMAAQSQRRAKYAKGDMSSYGYLLGKKSERGEPVWEISEKWFTLYMNHGGSGLVKGPRGAGKSLLGTNSVCLPYIETFRHVVSGVFADSIKTKILDKPFDYYHYHNSMNKQLQTAIQIKIDSLEKQRAEDVENPVHPLVVDMIDEAALSKGKYRTSSDKVMQQMYVAAIARHIGIFVLEIHPFDTEVIWVRESVTHKYEFTERGKLTATVYKLGDAIPKKKNIWGFKSLEKRIQDGDSHIKYRPYAPESFTVDVDVIAMLDNLNKNLELKLEKKEEIDEIDEWRNIVKWLKTDKESQLAGAFGLSYGNVVSSLAIFLVQLERYHELMKGSDKYKPIRITQQLVESIMADGPFPVKRGTLAENIVDARRILTSLDQKERIREETEKEIIERLRKQGVPIDSDGNLLE